MIKALAVSVNYSDYLQRALYTWVRGFDEIFVVTDLNDYKTVDVCSMFGVSVFQTDQFYKDGRIFGKSLAISRAVEETGWMKGEGWRCLLDADICLPENWRQVFESVCPQTNFIYGARRLLEDGTPVPDQELPGYFQLFDSEDVRVQRVPLLDTAWRHAGGYDTEFQARWPAGQRIVIPMQVTHLGRPFENWWGRGNKDEMNRMWRARRHIHPNNERI